MTPAIDPAKVEDEKKPWWYPELVDASYLARLREDYPEHAAWGDDELRSHYDCESRYGVTWDHIGDAYEEYEPLADAYLKAEGELVELREAATDVLKSIENYTSENKPESDWDEYDYMMIPKWKRLRAALAPPTGKRGGEVSAIQDRAKRMTTLAYQDHDPYPGLSEDAGIVARAYLAEHDETPIDEEFWRSIGGHIGETCWSIKREIESLGVKTLTVVFRDGDTTLYIHDEDAGDKYFFLPKLKTRSDVLRVCASLGIKTPTEE